MKEKRKPEEKKSSGQLLRDTAEGKLVRSSGILTELKERTSEELLHELQVHQIEWEMQNEELRKAQLALEESRQRFSDLYDFAPVGYFTLTPEALIKEVNLTGASLLETDRQQIINGRFRRFVAPSDFEQWDRHFLKVLKQGEKQACDLSLVRGDGSTFYAGLESIRMEVSRGEFEVHTTVTDITERKRAEETLQESEERYRDLVESSQDLICTHDLDGNLLSVNEGPVRALGYSREFLMQVKMRDLLTPEQHDQFEAYLKKIKEEGRASGILRLQTATGETRYWEYNNTLRTEGVVVPMVHGMAHDITERRVAELALKESEKKYRMVVDNMADNISVMDMNLRFTYISPSIMKLRGFTSEEAMDQILEQVVTPESLQIINKVFEEEMKLEAEGTADPGRSRILELEEYRKDGSTVWIENHLSFLRDEAQNPLGIISLSRDITDRKRVEEKLKESEKRYRELYDFLPTPVYEMDFEANITSVNRAIYETFRGTEEDLKKGFKAWQLLSPEETERSIKNIQRLLKGEKLEGSEYTLMRLDGSVFPAIVISSVIYRNDQPVGLRGVVVDITESKQAEEKLRESEELFKSYLEQAPDGVYLSDLSGTFLYGNRKCEEIIGYPREELIGKNFLELNILSENSLNKAVLSFQANNEGRATGPDEIDLINKEGRRIPVEINTNVVQRMGQNIVLSFVRDITERKRVEEQLQHTLESLRKSFRTIIQVMVSAVEARDPYTAGHQARSSDLARAVATEMGLSQEKIDGLRMAGSIHDIGKLSIPAEILSKPTKLTEIEFSLIKEHPQKGYDILKNVESPWPLADMVLQHHERMNGSGYPRGLKGDDILIEARILAVADVVEAMASYRPYRPALGIEAALEEIMKNKGTLYDGDAADACLRLFREKGFQLEGTCY